MATEKIHVHGDFAGHEGISIGGNISASNVAIGRGARASISNSVLNEKISNFFKGLYQELSYGERPAAIHVPTVEVILVLRALEHEVLKGELGEASPLERRLVQLEEFAPAIFRRVTDELTALDVLGPFISTAKRLDTASAEDRPRAATMQSILDAIDAARPNEDVRLELRQLVQAINVEVQRGDEADVARARSCLKQLVDRMPSLVPQLNSWLTLASRVSVPMQILARQMLSA